MGIPSIRLSIYKLFLEQDGRLILFNGTKSLWFPKCSYGYHIDQHSLLAQIGVFK